MYIFFKHLGHNTKIILDRRLALNLTVNRLFIHHTKNCQQGYFKIQFLNPSHEFQPYTYCGFMSATRLYPTFNYILITTVISCHRVFDFDAFVSVIDHKRVELIQQTSHLIFHPSFAYKTKQSLYLYCYKLQVTKASFVFLFFPDKSFANSVSIFDGPGIFSPLTHLAHHEISFNCSSFQCLTSVTHNLHLQPTNSPKLKQNDTTFTFVGKELTTINKFIMDDLVEHTIPQQLCSSNPCVLFVKIEHHTHINATVSSMKYKGLTKPDLSCDYGG